jgi:hypothetical protein
MGNIVNTLQMGNIHAYATSVEDEVTAGDETQPLPQTCDFPRCFQQNKQNSRFCHDHKCCMQDCVTSRTNKYYCTLHTCTINGCKDGIYDTSKYCESHKCRYSTPGTGQGCNSARSGKTNYCLLHKCKIHNCYRYKVTSDHCIIHKDDINAPC